MIESFWALLKNFGLVFKESPFCISKVLVLDIFLQIDMRRTAWLDALFALVSIFADKNRLWFFAQWYQLLITTTTITRDTLFYRGNLFNITKMFSHYFQDTRESVTGVCGEAEMPYSMQISSNSYVSSDSIYTDTPVYIISRRSYELLHFMDVSQIAEVRYF